MYDVYRPQYSRITCNSVTPILLAILKSSSSIIDLGLHQYLKPSLLKFHHTLPCRISDIENGYNQALKAHP